MRLLACSLVLVLLGCAGDAAQEGTGAYATWRPLLVAELERGQVDRPDDLYKFLHQGVMGPAHAVTDVAHARRWLAGEWSEIGDLDPAARPPLMVSLRPDSRLVRLDLVGLRHLVVAGGASAEAAALDTLAVAFARTGQRWQRDPALLAELWAAVHSDSALWHDHFTAAELADLDRQRGDAWPAVHHSGSYGERWAPHYRVVDPQLLPASWREVGGAP